MSRSAELYAQQLKKAHPNCILVDTTRELMLDVRNSITDGSIRFVRDIINDFGTGTIIIHHNPPGLQWLLCRLGRQFLYHKRIVAYLVWELEDLPSIWKHSLRFVDCVETPSTFSYTAIARNTHKSVLVQPHHVPDPCGVKQVYCVDGKLRCLFIFDLGSLCSRKNPEAVIEAFVSAFAPDEGLLTIKIGQHITYAQDFERVQQLAAGHPHIRLLTDWLDDKALHRLYLEHDVYPSLHRSEGYGLTIREALLRKLYVVATAWSGNMDFMKGGLVCPVPYKLIPVDRKYAVFNGVPHARWADPEIPAAAEILRKLRRRLFNGAVELEKEHDVFDDVVSPGKDELQRRFA